MEAGEEEAEAAVSQAAAAAEVLGVSEVVAAEDLEHEAADPAP